MNPDVWFRESLRSNKFWPLVDAESSLAQKNFAELWKRSETDVLSSSEACSCLNSLFIYSHARIKGLLGRSYLSSYPTTKCTPSRLAARSSLWWVDHFTGGISHSSTLNWFGSSSEGKASTHFLLGYHGDPFYIVPLQYGAWHTPARNADSWSIEMVNAGPVTNRNGSWFLWSNRQLPEELVKELPPQVVDPPYKGAKYFQPFTRDQVLSNIKLKRILRWATCDELLARSRMSQHSQWQAGKSDMGPLWPLDHVNDAAFDDCPLQESRAFHAALLAIGVPGPICREMEDDSAFREDLSSEAPISTEEIQRMLVLRGHKIRVDGIYGNVTKARVMVFQRSWNTLHPGDKLIVDGIAGPQTLDRLRRKK